jgi:leucyl aminopeptidase
MDFDIEVESRDADRVDSDLIIYLVPRKNNDPVLKHVPELPGNQLDHFDAEQGETSLFYETVAEADRCLLFGLGDEDPEGDEFAQIGGDVLNAVEEADVNEAHLVFPLFIDGDRTAIARALSVGIRLSTYEFDEYIHDEDGDDEDEDEQENDELESLVLLVEDGRSMSTVKKGHQEASAVAGAVSHGRDLGNTPANELVPEDLAERARGIRDEYDDVSLKVWDQDDLLDDGMHLLNAVGKGSENPPRLIKFHYEPSHPKAHVGLAGKGVTFDTGGISIKPSKKMDEMKFDMCGAAAVFGLVRALAELEWPLEVTALVPAAENMPGHRSVKPGDVVTGYHGKSVEILNTDAEGRLCLADALGWISDNVADDLDLLVDFATLTGACIKALGHEAAGLMGNDDELCEELMEAGQSVQERVWQLPLWEDHSEQMDSEIADVKNIGGKAGAITAGAFLREFVDEDEIEHWAHLDIAGTGWGMKELSYRPSGGTGFGIRLMLEYFAGEYALR